jgi:RNA methyltransferase, TrmH family
MSLSRAREKLMARLRSRRLREREGLVLVEGPHAIGVALEAGARFRFAVVAHDAAVPVVTRLRSAGVEVLEVPPATLAELADTENPQGLLAVVEEPSATLEGWGSTLPPGEPPGPAPLLVLDRIQDPGNAGTLIRSAAAFGSPGVVALDGTVDPWNPKVVRASAGEAFRIPVVRTTWETFDAWRRSRGLRLFVADAGGEDVRALQAHPGGRGEASRAQGRDSARGTQVLLVGNEGAGPRPEALAASGTILALPLAPGVESLNAAMAGSILLWALGPGASGGGSSSQARHDGAPPSSHPRT